MAAKVKLKLDADKIKRFVIQHSEKLVMGALCLVSLFLLYKGALRETFKLTPQELTSASQSATTQLQQSVLDPKAQGINVIDYAAKAEEQIQDLAVAGWEWEPIRHPIWPRGSLRGLPVLLAVEDLEVHAGRGAFDIRAAGAAPAAERAPAGRGRRREEKPEPAALAAPPAPVGGGNIAGHRYVVILGRVPLPKQIEAYRATFADAAVRRPEDEFPDYQYVSVERAEIVTGAPNEKLKWVAIHSQARKVRDTIAEGGRRNDPVRAPLVHDKLTEALPPLHGQDFAPKQVVHSTMLGDDPPDAPAPAAADPVGPDDVPPDAPVDGPPADAPAAAPAPAGGSSADSEAGTPPLSTANEALLFRYFDFTVEPGKQYRYRVKLWLTNPNFGVDDSQLTDEALQLRKDLANTPKRDEFIKTPESKPSDPVYVMFDGELVAGQWTPAGPAKEPSVSVGVEQWTANDGARAQFVKGLVYRGQLVNFQVPGPSNGPGTQPQGAAVFEVCDNIPKKNEAEIPFRTEVAVLDMAPAPPAPGTKVPPADILVLDASGHLRVFAAKEMAERFREIAENFDQVNQKEDKQDSPLNDPSSALGGGSSLGKPPRRPKPPR